MSNISGHKISKSEQTIRRTNAHRGIGASCQAPSELNSSTLNLNHNFKLPPHLLTAKRKIYKSFDYFKFNPIVQSMLITGIDDLLNRPA